ncbi:MAG: M1 family metallopeptidase [Promethearchaeota archaeon]
MANKNPVAIFIALLGLFIIPMFVQFHNEPTCIKNVNKHMITSQTLKFSDYDQYSKGNFTNFKCSNYTLSVILNETTDSILGSLTVDYYNNDPATFDRLPFHLYVFGMRYDNRPGNIEIFNITNLTNPKTELEYEVLPEEHLMWVTLSSALIPGERAQFSIEFNIILPDGGYDRSNVNGTDTDNNRIYKFANSYPMPCVYDKYDGWNVDPYYHDGDPFYFDMAYYDFYIEVPNDMIVAATGELLSVSYIGARKILHYDPHYPVREVTFSASKYFEVESEMFKNVNISTFFLPEDDWLWSLEALNLAKDTVELFNNTFGIYPYNTLNIVEEYSWAGGMEYPCQVYIANNIKYWPNYAPDFYLEMVIVHEIGHQWFYQLVGNDEVDWAFLDEGLTIWITDYYRDLKHPEWQLLNPHYYLETVREYYLNNGLPNKINQSIGDFVAGSGNYVYVTYQKTPVIFDYLRRFIGMDTFLIGLNNFVKEFYFEIATLSDLQRCFESIVGYSLDWYFLPWFNNEYLPKYSFEEINFDSNMREINITITDLNENANDYYYSQKIPLIIYHRQNELFKEQVWINGTTTLKYSLSKTPTKIELLYTDDVIVQFSEDDQLGISSTDIKKDGDAKKIAGYPICLFLTLIIIIGVIVYLKRRVIRIIN